MKIIQDFIPRGRNNRPGGYMVPSFITVHDTANPAAYADAEAHAAYLQSPTAANKPVAWHFSVDDTMIVQHLPLNEPGYHAGDGNGPGNKTTIGIEICENADGNRLLAEDNAARLIAHLLVQFDHLSMSDVVQHNRWSGKNCPHIIRGRNGWNDFLKLVDSYDPEKIAHREEQAMVEELRKELAATKAKLNTLERQGLEKLNGVSVRLERLEGLQSMPEVPGWAKEAVDAAVKVGLIDTPEKGSFDFYRTVTVLHRQGIF